MIRLDIIRIVFMKELREMLRDRRSLAVMFGLPLVLYPLIAIGVSTLASSKQQEYKEKPARVAVENAADAPELVEQFRKKGTGIQLEDSPPPADAISKKLQLGELDAVVVAPERAQARAVAGEAVEISVRLDRSRTVSMFVERKINKVLDDYQRWVLEQRLKKYDAPVELLQPLKSTFVDVASSDKVFGRILSQMLPLLLLMTGMLGALFPALNATTTERELGTLETLLVTPAGRTELLLAKGALVLISALLAAGLNVLSMSLVLLKALSAIDKMPNLTISPTALLLSYLAAVPALIFFSVIVLIVGLLARNFREANSFATPVMLLPLASMAVGIAEPVATPAILVTPVANTTVIIREVLTGHASLGAFALAFGSSCLYAGIVLSLASRVFSSEQLVNPAWEPVSLKGLRRTKGPRPRRLPPVDAAMALVVVSLLLQFYLSTAPPKDLASHSVPPLIPLALVSQLLLMLGPTLLFAKLFRWDWVKTMSWRRAAPTLFVGAFLLGVGLMPWVNILSFLQSKVWPAEPGPTAKLTQELIIDALTRWPMTTILLIGTLAGVCEELLFRGPLQAALLRRIRPSVVICITAFLFAAVHMDLHGLPLRFLLGVLLGWIVWRGGSIFPAMLLHGIYDATQLVWLAIQIRMDPQFATTAATEVQTFTRTDAMMLAGGGVLIVIAVLLIRAGLPPKPEPSL